ncbi:MAG: HipA domain-containing protein [Ignavibacteriota bacterium]|jgi:serine/threonine-protein kinase HipA|nr:MAG: type II toxin-antitoxin system HipA family toxin [Chlorobiota bacterium]MBE7475618.1 HipA domain-containing protein [Ignavibacteriales bacterium]MBL1123072.1 type II toxin-antitoxin system HipA family toxin [Ignavibacteriota bacterium]MCE7855715.1 type II toxin-antitoxin system HipA family toxin [Ignavibacteria bacterium CHB3]MCZ7615467.1 HipA domain-containing protein [Ignavibacteriaceae bacterium]
MSKCLYCYNKLEGGEKDFHPVCSKKFFGSQIPPLVDLDMKKIKELAVEALGKSISVPGVQPKLSLDFKGKGGKENRLTIVGLWGRFILKPPFNEYPEMPELEDVTMHLSELLNINTAEHSLIKLKSGELAYISKRFDRTKNGKLHVEDMAQLTGTLTENKYRSSMEKVGNVILKYSSYPGIDAIRLFELTLFSFITGNSDMHLKNFSLIRNEDNEIMLSPAYDLLSTKLLIPKDKEDLALPLNGKKNNFKKKDFDLFASQLGINETALKKIYLRFGDLFQEMKTLINKSFLSKEMKEKYFALLDDRRKALWN